MSTAANRAKAAERFRQQKNQAEHSDYDVGASRMSIEGKLRLLEEMDRGDLVGIFKEWQPKVSKRRRRGAPLDQRVSITVTDMERTNLNDEIKTIKMTVTGL